MQQLFSALPDVTYFIHDNTGWDIGGYVALAKEIHDDFMLCVGSTGFFTRAGWLERMVDMWRKHGPGLYGSLATFEITPHLNTSGFWCEPGLLALYPKKVLTKTHRYEFEHGKSAFWKIVTARGVNVMLATWDGEYEWRQWRLPPNIYLRGDQSNCLTQFRISYLYEIGRAHV